MDFCSKLAQLRYERGMNQEELAEVLGISRSSIAKWEAGKGMPKIANLIALSRLFGVTIDELLKDEETYRNKQEDTI